MLQGIDRKEAGDFTFLLSIPIIAGSALVEGLGMRHSDIAVSVLPLLLGMITAFFSGILSIKLFLKVLKTSSFYPFAIYTACLAVLTLIVMR